MSITEQPKPVKPIKSSSFRPLLPKPSPPKRVSSCKPGSIHLHTRSSIKIGRNNSLKLKQTPIKIKKPVIGKDNNGTDISLVTSAVTENSAALNSSTLTRLNNVSRANDTNSTNNIMNATSSINSNRMGKVSHNDPLKTFSTFSKNALSSPVESRSVSPDDASVSSLSSSTSSSFSDSCPLTPPLSLEPPVTVNPMSISIDMNHEPLNNITDLNMSEAVTLDADDIGSLDIWATNVSLGNSIMEDGQDFEKCSNGYFNELSTSLSTTSLADMFSQFDENIDDFEYMRYIVPSTEIA
ncbi:hypothetical protein DASB73_007410 [Starmerella bacillaris]|uniref:Hap4 transcription factor heteromerisation domain-containing protein n=1 Tax=Starmerella bacillaris TaxID=1247836 RepID=A0AAV5RG94_STABA|nr:hypothetical protein DASB73_007410 [Starmerella bacillaris]